MNESIRNRACRRMVWLFVLLGAQGCDAFNTRLLAPRTHSDAITGDSGALEGDRDASAPHTQEPSARDAQAGFGGPERDSSFETDEGALDASAQLDASDEPACADEDAGDIDSDGDGTVDCVDKCADDPAKSAPGVCGCSHPDHDVDGIVSCAGLRDALVHRWRFGDRGTAVADARGEADGELKNAQGNGTGSLILAGGTSDQYVDLPNGVISSFTNTTIEAWVTWQGAGYWQRIFDFGDSDGAAEGDQGMGQTYLMLSPRVSVVAELGTTEVMTAAFATAGPDSAIFVSGDAAFPIGGIHHVALVFDDSNDAIRLYLDGTLRGSALVTGSLASIHDWNNWLGRSQYAGDAELDGAYHELRIYDRALSDAQIALSFAGGSDPAFLSDFWR